jgi:glycolate oxidase FAD binding subunit
MEAAVGHFRDAIRDAASGRRRLRLRGGGSKDFYGRAAAGELLDTRGHAGIVAYDPTELVITARCGTTLADVETALEARGQMLAFEPPHFDGNATFGGAVAAGLSGPARATSGAVRDYVLGARIMDGRGRELVFGGQVMKNVAGYDVSRLMAGSLGTLALILECSVKTLPRPPARSTRRLELAQSHALEALHRWAAMGLCVSGTAWHDGVLSVRLSGASPAVETAGRVIGGAQVEADADRFWRSVRDHRHPFFMHEAMPLWRLSLPATTPPLEMNAEQFVEWGGALRWLRTMADAAEVREIARRAGGHATLFRGGDRTDVFHPLSPAVAALHRRLKSVFDPGGIFNPGRMYEGL